LRNVLGIFDICLTLTLIPSRGYIASAMVFALARTFDVEPRTEVDAKSPGR